MADRITYEAIGYDPDAQELHVRFVKSGETYVYTKLRNRFFRNLCKRIPKVPTPTPISKAAINMGNCEWQLVRERAGRSGC